MVKKRPPFRFFILSLTKLMNCTFGVGSFKRGIHIKYSYYIHNKVLIILEEDKLDFPVWYSLEETHEPFCFHTKVLNFMIRPIVHLEASCPTKRASL